MSYVKYGTVFYFKIKVSNKFTNIKSLHDEDTPLPSFLS